MCKQLPERDNISDSKRITLDRTCGIIQRGAIYWMKDMSSVGQHLYMVVSATYNDRNGRIMCLGLDSRPYYDRMIPIVVNGEMGFINPTIIYNFTAKSFRKENFSGFLMDPTVWEFVDSYMAITIGIQKMSEAEIEKLDSRLYRYENHLFAEFFNIPSKKQMIEEKEEKAEEKVEVKEEKQEEEKEKKVEVEEKEEKKHKTYVRIKDIPMKDINKVKQLRAAGMSLANIAKETGLGMYAVNKIVNISGKAAAPRPNNSKIEWKLDANGKPVHTDVNN